MLDDNGIITDGPYTGMTPDEVEAIGGTYTPPPPVNAEDMPDQGGNYNPDTKSFEEPKDKPAVNIEDMPDQGGNYDPNAGEFKEPDPEAEAVTKRWEGKIKDAKFTGTDAEYEEYKRDIDRLNERPVLIKNDVGQVVSKVDRKDYDRLADLKGDDLKRELVKLGIATEWPESVTAKRSKGGISFEISYPEKTTSNETNIRHAERALEPFKDPMGRYRLADAMVSDDPKVKAAIKTLFKEKDIADTKDWIDRNWGEKSIQGYTVSRNKDGQLIASYQDTPIVTNLSRGWQEVTPWDESKGQTFSNWISGIPLVAWTGPGSTQKGPTLGKVTEQFIRDSQGLTKLTDTTIPGAAPVLGVAITGTKAIPSVVDDAVVYAIIAGLAGVQIAKGAKVPDEITKAVNSFKSDYARPLTTADLIITQTKAGEVKAFILRPAAQEQGEAKPKLETIPTETEGKRVETIPTEPQKAMLETPTTITEPKKTEGATVLPSKPIIEGPTLETPQFDDYVNAAEQYEKARQKVEVAVKERGVTEQDWEALLQKALDERQALDGKEFAKQMVDDINRSLRRRNQADLSREMADIYRRLAEDVAAKRMAMEEARKSYVASLNPTPVQGKASVEDQALIAAVAAQRAKSDVMAERARKAAEDAYDKAMTRGKTATQARAAARQAVHTALASQTRTGVSAKQVQEIVQQVSASASARAQAATMTQASPLVNAAATTAAPSRTVTRTRARTTSKARAGTKVSELARVKEATATKIRLSQGDEPQLSNNAKRAAFANSIGIQAGAVVHAVKSPYRDDIDEATFSAKNPPPGMTIFHGPRAGYKAVKVLKGKAPTHPVNIDIGNQDATLKPHGEHRVSISYKPDPLRQTTGDITSGERRRQPIIRRRRVRIPR